MNDLEDADRLPFDPMQELRPNEEVLGRPVGGEGLAVFPGRDSGLGQR